MPVLMWGFFTPMLPATAPEVCPPHTRSIKMKGKQHGQYILETKHGVFTPLILSSYGGMGSEAQTFYKRLANLLSTWCAIQYSHGLPEMQAVFCLPQICSHVHPREQILHAPHHQRPLWHSPHLQRTVCHRNSDLIPLNSSTTMNKFPKLSILQKYLLFCISLPLHM